MRKRTFDARVGFCNQYDVFEEESQKSDKEVFAWRLEPKSPEDAEKKEENLLNRTNCVLHRSSYPDKWKNISKQELMIGKLLLKLLVGKCYSWRILARK
jgi:hypothetical protein